MKANYPFGFSYGQYSPFSEEERQTIESVYAGLDSSDNDADGARAELEEQFQRLEALGELLSRFPDARHVEQIGNSSVERLVDTLCQTTPVSFEFDAPTRATVGRAMDVAEVNFYRLLWVICDQMLTGETSVRLRDETEKRRRTTVYKMMTEEILSNIVSDSTLGRAVRERGVRSLVEIWNRRLTYEVSDFFPVLQATWEARARIKVVGGTLLGTQELFALLREGCDPEFVELFTRPDPTEDEVEAFREFLFGKTAEELDQLRAGMQRSGTSSIRLDGALDSGSAPRPRFYEFFRSRSLQASARRLAGVPGPKRTAEGYVLISFLSR